VTEGPPSDELTPAEARLLSLLVLLRSGPPGGPEAARVMRAVRWERVLRRTLLALGGVAVAMTEGVALLFGRARTARRAE
jgi:hypothetical protein